MVPVGCRRCCKGAKRTSCNLFYKQIFGETKQLGLVLRNTHAARHFWVLTTDKLAKLDCMLFSKNDQ